VAFVQHGIKQLAILDINSAGMKETKDLMLKIKSEVEVLTLEKDLSDEQSIVAGIKEIVHHFGRIDIAVNNVGKGGELKPSTETSVSEFKEVLDLNLIGLWVAQREEIRQMLTQEPLTNQ
jgi:NAD(P)-dependent dehydrogenase (short-subunit alcohol dehydrogenase family)